MKNLKKGNVVQRLSEVTAEDRAKITSLLNDGWEYCPNSKWKAYRDAQAKRDMDNLRGK